MSVEHVSSDFQGLLVFKRLHLFRIGRQKWIERPEGGVINGFGKNREGGKELAALLWNCLECGVEDVVAFLDEV